MVKQTNKQTKRNALKPGPQMIKAAAKVNDLATWDANLHFL